MKSLTARFRTAGSLVAGLLIGTSIVIPAFAMATVDYGDGSFPWAFGAPLILALGIALHVAAIAEPLHRRAADPGPLVPPAGFAKLRHGH
jgi:hypothetical protein